MRYLRLLTGIVSLFIGVILIVWILFNLLIKTEPVYTGPATVIALIIGGFGFGTTLTHLGWHQLMLFLGKTNDSFKL